MNNHINDKFWAYNMPMLYRAYRPPARLYRTLNLVGHSCGIYVYNQGDPDYLPPGCDKNNDKNLFDQTNNI